MVRVWAGARQAGVKLASEDLPPKLHQPVWALRENSLMTHLWGYGVRGAWTEAGLS